MIGQTISHYKILEKLGEGGMGVVYKAEDTKLRRIVAIKFLPKRLAVHGEERERFEHEAQAASSLNHPNICTIHEVDEVNDETFIAMEYIDGITLREWVRRKSEQVDGYRKLGLQESVNIATQIAEGLEKAHEKGIIHRDIKSENIMVTNDVRAKIMDFGLAKLKGVSKLTKIGSTVGTLAYMSPEQVEGMETDHRTDIFSFGVVLYEMFAGLLPFRAEHETAMMYEIINVEPQSLLDLRKGIDAELNRIVIKCLEKNREERYQSMREVTVDLKRYKRDSEGRRIERKAVQPSEGSGYPSTNSGDAGEAEPVGGLSPSKSKTPIVVVGAAVVVLVIAGVWYFTRQTPPTEIKIGESKITKFTSLPGLEDEPTWSPDGKFLAYTADDRGNFDILVQPVGGGQVIRVADSDADDAQPAWSPDGSKLAFVSARDRGRRFSMLFGQVAIGTYLKGKGGDIFLVPPLGGRPVKLVSNGFDPAWSPDGKTIVYRSIQGGQWDLWTVSAEGGAPKQLTNDIDVDYQPAWSPDGKWILYGSGIANTYYEIRVSSSSGGSPKPLTNHKAAVVKPTWSPDGKFVLFSSNRSGSMNIWKMPFKPDSKEFLTPVRITVGEGDDVNISAASVGSTIAFSTVKSSPDVWEFTVRSHKLRQLSFETGWENHPVLSPDGKMLLVTSNRGGTVQLWAMDLDGKFLSQLTTDTSLRPGDGGYWSPDGKEIVYSRDVQEKFQGVVRTLGEISPKRVIDDAYEPFWSPDGKKLVFVRFNAARTKRDVWVHVLDTGEEKQLTSLEWNTGFPSWSADGNWIAFNVDKKNTREVWVISSSGGTPRLVLTGEPEYSHPQWSPRDNDVILCLRDHKDIVQVSVSTGKVKELYKFTESGVNLIDYPTWSPDGQKVYFSLFRKTGDVYTLENY